MDYPLISVITPSYNRSESIEVAIHSVLDQNYPLFEHIVIDGVSSDRTHEVLARFPHLITVVEEDKGLYDAINKGIKVANGEIIGLLNTDDYYESGIFQEVARVFREQKDVDVVIGQASSVRLSESGAHLMEPYPTLRRDSLLAQLVSGPPAINAWFFRRELFERIGDFDLNFPIGADRDFLIRLCCTDFTPYFVDRIFYYYRRHANSLTVSDKPDAKIRFMTENLRLARKYMSLTSRDAEFWHQCQTWHDLTSIELSIVLTRQRRWKEVVEVISAAVRQNPRWLFHVLAQSPDRMKNFILKKRRISANP